MSGPPGIRFEFSSDFSPIDKFSLSQHPAEKTAVKYSFLRFERLRLLNGLGGKACKRQQKQVTSDEGLSDTLTLVQKRSLGKEKFIFVPDIGWDMQTVSFLFKNSTTPCWDDRKTERMDK
ncbi:hypothetical protein JTB14_019387 [Gonioctena quinquepunctata]|nr:hypothetical protein JTB14_019387 [Gonioctena quinquepunctata]